MHAWPPTLGVYEFYGQIEQMPVVYSTYTILFTDGHKHVLFVYHNVLIFVHVHEDASEVERLEPLTQYVHKLVSELLNSPDKQLQVLFKLL
jgi:hypothetical protein